MASECSVVVENWLSRLTPATARMCRYKLDYFMEWLSDNGRARERNIKITIILLLFILAAPCVYAHTPLTSGGENNSIESALELTNPTKSWTMYRELHEVEEVEYFKLHLKAGEKFQFSVSTPRSEDPNFVPSAVVIWPGSDIKEDVPSFVEVPTGCGASLVKGLRPPATEYEPFTPTSYYFVVDYAENVVQEGNYYIAVFEPQSGGKYGLAIGYVEEFTAVEWLKIPFDLLVIHVWEGQSLLMILVPLLLTLIIGFPLLHMRYKLSIELVTSVGLIAGLLDVGSGLMTFVQMVIAINGANQTETYPLTLLFALTPIILGVLIILKTVRYKSGWSTKDRAIIVTLGALSLVFWAGLIAGPILAIILGLFPPWNRVN